MVVPTQGRVSAQTDRKRCEFAKGSVKFRNVTEEQEKRRTRKENWLKRKTNSFSAFERQEQQPGRILETVNSDNNKSLTRRSHRRVFLFGRWTFDFVRGIVVRSTLVDRDRARAAEFRRRRVVRGRARRWRMIFEFRFAWA
jgi:hypothetical protein